MARQGDVGARHAPDSVCRACGACCAFSAEWPRFSTEDDAALARIPDRLVDVGRNRMRCNGDRCAALDGEVGAAASCVIYEVRPDVCRACTVGDDACNMARRRFGLRALSADDVATEANLGPGTGSVRMNHVV